MSEVTTQQAAVPVTIIGGYLGSGKTTLVNHLLRNANGKRLAILVNEFGELPIDADLIEAKDDDIISLSGGCVCCSYGNDLIMAMMDLAKLDPRPDHIVLEASGVALPISIVHSLSLLEGYTMDGIVVLADAETVQDRASEKYMGDTILRQLEHADIVLLNKTDLVAPDHLQSTKQWLTELSADSIIVETERSIVPLEVVLQDFEPAAVGAKPHHHTSAFSTRKLDCNDAVEPYAFAQSLVNTTPGLVRAKGFVKDKDGVLHTIQIVAKRFEIHPAPEGVEPGLVVITAGG